MKKLTVKKLINFRSKTPNGKRKFVENITSNKAEEAAEGGGDYWIRSVSAISRFYPTSNQYIIDEKIDEIIASMKDNKYAHVKVMYQRNIDILKNVRQFDLKQIKPSKKITILKKSSVTSLLIIRGLQVQALPNHVFTYKKNDIEYVGGIWFLARLKAFTKEELAMFTEMLYRCIRVSLGKKYTVDKDFCIAMDILKNEHVNYSQIERGEVHSLLVPTLDEISKLM